jgi:hypothetical protein
MGRNSDLVQDAFAAAAVLAWRLPMLWAMTLDPTPRRRAEALRMITEKSAAAAEAMVGAQAELMLALLRSPGHKTAEKITSAMVKPARRRMKANAARLKRRKRL